MTQTWVSNVSMHIKKKGERDRSQPALSSLSQERAGKLFYLVHFWVEHCHSFSSDFDSLTLRKEGRKRETKDNGKKKRISTTANKYYLFWTVHRDRRGGKGHLETVTAYRFVVVPFIGWRKTNFTLKRKRKSPFSPYGQMNRPSKVREGNVSNLRSNLFRRGMDRHRYSPTHLQTNTSAIATKLPLLMGR